MNRIALFAAALLGASVSARASLTTVFNNVSPVGSNSGFNYTISLPSGDTLDTSLTTDSTPSGDFVTIYDIPGFVSASAPAGWTVSTQLLGLTPDHQLVADNAALTNVTFKYSPIIIGASPAAVSGPASITGFQIVSTSSAQVKGSYTSQDSDTDQNTVQAFSHTTIPAAVPEPASMGVIAGAALLLHRRGKRSV